MALKSLKVGLFLGWRSLARGSVGTTILVVTIMTLTLLMMVSVEGILVGLIEGSFEANRSQYTGDVIIKTPSADPYISKSNDILTTLNTIEEVGVFSARAIQGASIEANYRTRRDFQEKADTVPTLLTGIDSVIENQVTNLSNYVVEGRYLQPDSDGEILLGANLLARYSADFGDGFDSIDNVFPDSKVRVTVSGVTREFTVVGILDSKVNETSLRAFIPKREFQRLTRRPGQNVNEIAILGKDDISPEDLKAQLVRSKLDENSVIQTTSEAQGQFLRDIAQTFGLLGIIVGGIVLVVASITIFIIIFINAITRRKYIGILKGIGVTAQAIEISYVFQAMCYAVAGTIAAVTLIYSLLVPFFAANPLDFPFSDGILVAPVKTVTIRVLVLLGITALAGFVPAHIITRKNTLDSILGR